MCFLLVFQENWGPEFNWQSITKDYANWNGILVFLSILLKTVTGQEFFSRDNCRFFSFLCSLPTDSCLKKNSVLHWPCFTLAVVNSFLEKPTMVKTALEERKVILRRSPSMANCFLSFVTDGRCRNWICNKLKGNTKWFLFTKLMFQTNLFCQPGRESFSSVCVGPEKICLPGTLVTDHPSLTYFSFLFAGPRVLACLAQQEWLPAEPIFGLQTDCVTGRYPIETNCRPVTKWNSGKRFLSFWNQNTCQPVGKEIAFADRSFSIGSKMEKERKRHMYVLILPWLRTYFLDK